MIEMLLCTSLICLAISYTVCWLMKREIVSLQDKLAEAKADAIKSVEEFTEMQNKMREVCLQVTKERDQIKKDYDYVRNALWEECETSSELRHSRAAIIDHCRKLKRELANEKRASEHLSSECYTLTKQHDAAIAERDHARKLMDETRQRCGAEIDVLEDTIRDLGRGKSMSENRVNQLLIGNKRLASACMGLRQSREKIIEHCRILKRSQKDLRNLTDYILDELTTINTSR